MRNGLLFVTPSTLVWTDNTKIMFTILKALWKISAAISGFVIRIIWNFFLAFVLALAIGIGLYLFGDFRGAKRGVNSMVHYKVRAEQLAADNGAYRQQAQMATDKAVAAEKQAATFLANWNGEKSRRRNAEENNRQLAASNERLVAAKSRDRDQIAGLQVLVALRHDTIRRQQKAHTILTANYNEEQNSRQALAQQYEELKQLQAETQLVANRVRHADQLARRGEQVHARGQLLVTLAVSIAVLHFLTAVFGKQVLASLPTRSAFQKAAVQLINRLPFL